MHYANNQRKDGNVFVHSADDVRQSIDFRSTSNAIDEQRLRHSGRNSPRSGGGPPNCGESQTNSDPIFLSPLQRDQEKGVRPLSLHLNSVDGKHRFVTAVVSFNRTYRLGVKIVSLISHTLTYNKTVRRINQNQAKVSFKT